MVKKTVLHVVPNYEWCGGIRTWLTNTIGPFEVQRFNHHLCTIHSNGIDESTQSAETCQRFLTVSHVELRYFCFPVFMLNLIRLLKKVNPDIIHIHNGWNGAIASVAAKIAGVKVRVLFFHTGDWDHAGGLIRSVFSLVFIAFGRLSATHFWFASQACRARWIGKMKLTSRVIRTGIDLESFVAGDKQKTRSRMAWPVSSFIIGHVGRFSLPKNHKVILQVFRAVAQKEKDVLLVLIGDGPLIEEAKETARMLGILEKIQFLGKRQDIVSCLTAMDILLFPSLYESLGIAVLEAQAVGLPVVASNVPGLFEAVAPHWRPYMAHPTEVDKLTESLLALKHAKRFVPLDFLKQFDLKSAQEVLDNSYLDAISIKG